MLVMPRVYSGMSSMRTMVHSPDLIVRGASEKPEYMYLSLLYGWPGMALILWTDCGEVLVYVWQVITTVYFDVGPKPAAWL